MGKVTNNSGIPVFAQLIKLLDKKRICTIAEKMGVNRYTKHLDGFKHLVLMLYSVFANLNSLRELELGFLVSATRMNHFGLDYMVRRSTLSDANAKRSPKFFEKVYYHLYELYKGLLSDSRPVKDLDKRLFIMDSTTISLFNQVFKGTGRNSISGKKKGGAKAHTVISADEDVPVFVVINDASTSDHILYTLISLPAGSCITFDMGYVDYEEFQKFTEKEVTYVTREKKRCKRKVVELREIPKEDQDIIVSDEIVDLKWNRKVERPMTKEELRHRRGRRPKNGIVMVQERHKGTHRCRRITKWKDNKDEGQISFLTNDFETSAAVICEIYRRRWQIETLYKRLKQNFPLKYFLGDSRNVIEIQIWVSLIAWLLMRVVQVQVKRKWSMSNLLTTVRIVLNSYVDLYELLDCPERHWFDIVKTQEEDPYPSLFD